MESKLKCFLILMYTIFALFSQQSVHAARKLPVNFPQCRRSDKNINDCLLKATELVRPFLIKGIPELGIPPITSLVIPKIVLEQGTQALSYKTQLTNLTITGLANYHFTKFDFDQISLVFHTEVDMPLLTMNGQYVIEGKILAAQIEGKGDLYVKTANSNGTVKHYVKYIEKKGITYMVTDKLETKLHIGEVLDYDIQGSFQNSETLATATNNVIRENMREIIDEMLPAVEKVMTTLFEDLIFKKLSKFPVDKLYPE